MVHQQIRDRSHGASDPHGCVNFLLRVATVTALMLLLAPAAGSQQRQVVEIVAERFSFTPSEIRVPRGTVLELRIRSEDTSHGFRIVGAGVNLAVPKRRQGEVTVIFEAREVGRYTFECSRLCGAGHNFMRGAIVVRDEAGRSEP